MRNLAIAAKEQPETERPLSHRFGERMKAFRVRKGLSLRELSARTGLSVGILSQTERNVTSPSLKTLTKLRIGLGVPLSAFFEDEEAPSDGSAHSIVRRKAARPNLNLGEGVHKQLLSPATASNLQVMMLVVAPHGGTGDTVLGVPGEKAAVVLSGSLEITVGSDVIALDEGDAVQFDAETPHAFRNTGTEDAQVLWIVSQTPAERHI